MNYLALDPVGQGVRVSAQVRYKDVPSPAAVYPVEGGRVRVVFDEPKRAITPGQSIVMYDGDTLAAGGVIERILA